ncbi:heme exporter protein CcmD [Rubellimicrobium arenae]|uniref:heme exporter protein CcmD n=1 Tax=Rubellimicrobium arenae TaxID=2817372 RepID=UPI0034A1A30C
MMPELGKYAVTVLSAYGVTLVLLLGLTGLSWRRWRRLKAEMDRIERGRDG